jgi:hypothetical protein
MPRVDDRINVYASLGALAVVLLTGAVALAFLVRFVRPESDPRRLVGTIEDFEVGKPVAFQDGKFWLVRQPDGSVLALYPKTPSFQACMATWRETFSFVDGRDNQTKLGWFRDPCSGSTFDRYGVRVFGPAVRDLDRFPVEISGHQVYVLDDLSALISGDDTPYWAR